MLNGDYCGQGDAERVGTPLFAYATTSIAGKRPRSTEGTLGATAQCTSGRAYYSDGFIRVDKLGCQARRRLGTW